ncbi:hypothetical protein [Zhongshania sp. BJYM1]|uniref:hypothetical protein n=1 Tax=Zhongshania aquatica TaxID=2965069 RepID=UPI0022B539A5|nr:hypothetical protein [Marortus sp. BJYM1]
MTAPKHPHNNYWRKYYATPTSMDAQYASLPSKYSDGHTGSTNPLRSMPVFYDEPLYKPATQNVKRRLSSRLEV